MIIRLTANQSGVLNAIKQMDGRFTPLQVFEKCKDTVPRAAMDSSLAKWRDKGLLKKVAFGVLEKTKAFDKYIQNEFEIKPYGAQKALHAPKAVEQAPAINMSHQADKAADMISSVLKENSDYRLLLLKIHQTIGEALGLDQEKEG